jgi:hypothetical protein
MKFGNPYIDFKFNHKLQSVKFEIFTAVTMKNAVFWQVTAEFLPNVFQLLVTGNIVPSSPIIVTLMREAIHPSKTTVLTRATQRFSPEGGCLQVTFRITRIFEFSFSP